MGAGQVRESLPSVGECSLLLRVRWAHMGFGEQHFAGVTPEGRVMVCGSNSVGQLGLGPLVEECRSAPCRVHALDNAGGEIAAT